MEGDVPMNLHAMAVKIAFFLARKNIVPEEKQDVYAFGMEILLATAINGVLAVTVSVFLGVFWQSVLMLTPFMLLRSNTGGYHADSHLGCMLRFMAVYVPCLLLAGYISLEAAQPAALSVLAVSAAAILIIGPLPHRNRPVSGRELAAYKVKSRILTGCFLLTGLIGTYFAPGIFIYFAFGMGIAAGSLLAGCIKIKLERRQAK
jgi:accessory gene regulator B